MSSLKRSGISQDRYRLSKAGLRKMLAIPDHEAEVEAQAKTMLRETLQRSRWYPQHWREDWDRLIERDVELMWRVMAEAARQRLEQGRAG
jgi:hypothetical protein